MARKKKQERRTERRVLLFTPSENARIEEYLGKNGEFTKTFCPLVLDLVDNDIARKRLLKQLESADEDILKAMERVFNKKKISD